MNWFPVPRGHMEISEAVEQLLSEPQCPTLTRLTEGVLALLPPHAHAIPYGNEVEWTTPAGLWRLQMQFRDYATPLFKLLGPFGEWAIADPGLPHIQAVLVITGAIEENPHA